MSSVYLVLYVEKYLITSFSLPCSVLSLWNWPLTWKTIILQCYYTVGWVQGSNYWKSRDGDRLISTPKAPRPRRQRRWGCGEWGGGIPHPSRLGVWGSVVNVPGRCPERSPGRKRIWYISALKYDTWWQQFLWFFWESTYQITCNLNSRSIKAKWFTGACGAVFKKPLATGLFVLICVIDVGLDYFFNFNRWLSFPHMLIGSVDMSNTVDYCYLFVWLFVSL